MSKHSALCATVDTVYQAAFAILWRDEMCTCLIQCNMIRYQWLSQISSWLVVVSILQIQKAERYLLCAVSAKHFKHLLACSTSIVLFHLS